jgi:cobalt-precorrin 5A hydrolase
MHTGKLAVVVITRNGLEINRRIPAYFQRDTYVIDRIEAYGNFQVFSSLFNIIPELFDMYDAVIFIMALGAVVRLIAPFLKNKFEDKPVIAIDDSGRFVIPVVSGHHGANRLATEIAKAIDGTAVITTASDVNNLPSPEALAEKYGMSILNRNNIARISGDIINGHPVQIINETGIDIPELHGDDSGSKIIISYKRQEDDSAMIMVPKVLVLGIGFSTDATYSDMNKAIEFVFVKYSLYKEAVKSISTIDIKADNADLKEIAGNLNCSLNYYSPAELNRHALYKSDAVYRTTGAYSVANASARIASSNGRELVPKEIINNVTISVFLYAY